MMVSEWAQGRGSGHKSVSDGIKGFQWAQGHKGVSEHKDFSVGARALQWAQLRISGQKGVSVGIKTCQLAERSVSEDKGFSVGARVLQSAQVRISGQKGVSVGTKMCQLAEGSVSGHKGVSVRGSGHEGMSVDTKTNEWIINTSCKKMKNVNFFRVCGAMRRPCGASENMKSFTKFFFWNSVSAF